MKRLLIWLMKRELNRAKKDLDKETEAVFRKAKRHVVDNYTTTILFLKSYKL